MATIPPLPWYVDHHSSSPGAYLKDNTGNIVATFCDHQAADYYLHSVNDYIRLHDRVEELEEELKSLTAPPNSKQTT